MGQSHRQFFRVEGLDEVIRRPGPNRLNRTRDAAFSSHHEDIGRGRKDLVSQ